MLLLVTVPGWLLVRPTTDFFSLFLLMYYSARYMWVAWFRST